jgi:uncharacterized protein
MPNTANREPNRLIHEKSPYLLQHSYNPVDWYPWGEEAFKKARQEDKPIFMSIGYSTCHWCHVMAHESFEDEEVAEILNCDFVSIKVDREERPDIDAVYMEVCQTLTGSGGWPMTIIMTGDKKPFFAGTYLPKRSRGGMTGLTDLLSEISRRWRDDRSALLQSSEEITTYLQNGSRGNVGIEEPSKELLALAKEQYARMFDRKWGGFGSAPKFPIPHNLIFLLRYSALENDPEALSLAETTLTQMYRGGIFDHIGGGFSRYSTDEKWLVPHFEKMLYDNALLAWAYLVAYAATKRPLYKSVAVRTINYVLSSLWEPKGGFMCGQDADSEGVEGKYYLFSQEEIKSVLGDADGEKYCHRFGVDGRGFEGKSIPNLIDRADFDREERAMSVLTKRLYEYRQARYALHRDDKVLTSWNALMIIALAKAGRILKGAKYLVMAKRTQRFIARNLTDSRGRLLIRWREGSAANDGQLDDYAFYGLALVELYELSLDISYLTEAVRITGLMTELFSDDISGGFFLYAKDSEQLITRPRPVYDGAIPSGNSAAALLLTKLSKLTGTEEWRSAAEKQLSFISASSKSQPSGYGLSMLALTAELYPSAELVCVTKEAAVPKELLELSSRKAAENFLILLKTSENTAPLAAAAPFTSDYPLPESGTAYYLCRNGTCMQPVTELSMLESELEKR